MSYRSKASLHLGRLPAQLAKRPDGLMVSPGTPTVVGTNPVQNIIANFLRVALVKIVASKLTCSSLRATDFRFGWLMIVSYLFGHASYYWLKRYAKTKLYPLRDSNPRLFALLRNHFLSLAHQAPMTNQTTEDHLLVSCKSHLALFPTRSRLLRVHALPSFLTSFLSSFLPFFLLTSLSSYLTSFLPSFLPSFIPSCLISFLPSFLPSFLLSFLPYLLPSLRFELSQ